MSIPISSLDLPCISECSSSSTSFFFGGGVRHFLQSLLVYIGLRSPIPRFASGIASDELEKSRNPWPGNGWPASSNSLVCSRVLPVCQHRSVLWPRDIPTHAIKQAVLRRYLQSELVSHRQPKTTKERQIIPTATNMRFSNGSRSLMILSFVRVYTGVC